jgi:urease accessory protein
VPHEHSIFSAVNNIYIDEDCRLVWGEILTCGRKLNGEIFLLSKYHNRTAIYLHQKLVIKENLLIQPELINPDTIGQLEGHTHQASFIYLDANTDCTERSNTVYEYLELQKGIAFGVTAAPVNGLIIRLHGNKAEQLYECLKAISRLLAGAKKKTFIHAG